MAGIGEEGCGDLDGGLAVCGYLGGLAICGDLGGCGDDGSGVCGDFGVCGDLGGCAGSAWVVVADLAGRGCICMLKRMALMHLSALNALTET